MPSSRIVVAEVLTVRPHPNGERIFLADIDLGDGERRQVVFGGRRQLRAGDLVAAAPPGARLPTGVKMRQRRYRGESSFGMLCSTTELGWVAQGPDEVAVLPAGTAKPGDPVGSARPRIIFLAGGHTAIDRSWDHSDAQDRLQRMGYRVEYRTLASSALPQREELMKEGPAIVWPTSYTVDGDPEGQQIGDALSARGIPHVGASSDLMRATSKVHLAQLLVSVGLSTPTWSVIPRNADRQGMDAAAGARWLARNKLSYPVVLKSEYSAGSHGVARVDDGNEFTAVARRQLSDYGQNLVVQAWSRSREFTCAVISCEQGLIVAPIEIILDDKTAILDEQIKKNYKGLTIKPVSPELYDRLQALVFDFWTSQRGGDYARVDILEDSSGCLHIIDVNLLPSLDGGSPVLSFFPAALEMNYGLTYEDGLLGILASALQRWAIPLPDDMKDVAIRARKVALYDHASVEPPR